MVQYSVLLFLCINGVSINIALSASCNTDADCLFMGTCNTVTGTCRCSISCLNYPRERVCLSHMKYPRKPCAALSLACEFQQNVKMQPFNGTLFKMLGTCQDMPFTQHNEFCQDQSYCSGNGLCMQQPPNGKPYCRCNKLYTGERCQARLLEIKDTPSNPNTPTVSETESHFIGGSSMLGTIAPYAALGVMSVILTCCLVVGYAKRTNKCSDDMDTSADAGNQVRPFSAQYDNRFDDEIRRHKQFLELRASQTPQRKHGVAIEMTETPIMGSNSPASSMDSTTPL